MSKEEITRETKIIQYLDLKGFSPSQIRFICISLLKLRPQAVRVKVGRFISPRWIEQARVRFFKEDIAKEMKELGLL